MKHALQVEIIRRVFKLAKDRHLECGPDVYEIPVSNYYDPDHYEEEKDSVFRLFPLVVGFASQIAKPGDYITSDVVPDMPIMVIRADDGQVRAYINACRHRGSKLLWDAQGSGVKNIICPYHGWCYEKSGKLRGITHPKGFPGVDKSELGLIELPVDVRFGLIFVLPTPNESFDITTYLGPPADDFESYGLDDWVLYRATEKKVDFNWKIQIDAALETYHLHYLHTRTTSTGFFNNMAVIDIFNPCGRMVVPLKSMLELEKRDPAHWRLLEHASILYSLFPNTGYFLGNGYVHVLSTYPINERQSVLKGGMLVPKIETDERLAKLQDLHYHHYWETQMEDVVNNHTIQQTLKSGANDVYYCSQYENYLAAFHQNMEKAMAGELVI